MSKIKDFFTAIKTNFNKAVSSDDTNEIWVAGLILKLSNKIHINPIILRVGYMCLCFAFKGAIALYILLLCASYIKQCIKNI